MILSPIPKTNSSSTNQYRNLLLTIALCSTSSPTAVRRIQAFYKVKNFLQCTSPNKFFLQAMPEKFSLLSSCALVFCRRGLSTVVFRATSRKV